MLPLEAFAPTIALCAIAAAHVAYYLRHAGRRTQHVIEVVDYSTNADAANQTPDQVLISTPQWATERGCLRLGADDSLSRGNGMWFDDASMQIAARLGTRVYSAEDLRLESGTFVDVLICMSDLEINGQCTFLSPVKVGGDLIVNGEAKFVRPVVVNGHVRVRGAIGFLQGLVAKGQTNITGAVEIGAPERKAWLVAQAISVGSVARPRETVPTKSGVQQAAA